MSTNEACLTKGSLVSGYVEKKYINWSLPVVTEVDH